MPANLPPEYIEAEERFRKAQGDEEKISALQEMLSLLPNHKGTDKIEADIRRRISRLKKESQKEKGPARAKTPDQIEKQGAGQVPVCGLPNSGKSSLVDIVTNATPQVADFPFSTYGPTVGMMNYEDVQIQLIDVPPLSDDHVETWVFNLIRKADLVLLLADCGADPLARLEKSLALLAEQNIFLFDPEEDFSHQQVGRTNRKGLVVASKVDELDEGEREEELRKLEEKGGMPVVPLSILDEDSLDRFRQATFQALGMIRVYTKKPGKDPDLDEPYLLKASSTVMDAARSIHRELAKDLDYVRIWGSGRFDGQQVSRDHQLEDGDVIEIHIK